jgi:phage gpG-like protein
MAEYGFIYMTIDDGLEVKNLTFKVQSFGMQLTNLAPALENIGQDILDENMGNFAAAGGYYQMGGWAPLAPSTIADRLRKGYGEGPPLVRTALLRDSLTKRGAEGNVFNVTDTTLTVGTNVWYAGFHHWGTWRLAPRFLVGLRPFTMTKRINDRLVSYINGLIAATFKRPD